MFTVFTLKLLVISIGTTVAFPASDVQSWPLLDQIQSRAGLLQQTNGNAVPLHNGNVAAWNKQADIALQSVESSSSPTPPGSMTNVCDNFCPKWCRKGQLSGERECHYACTNLCDKKVRTIEIKLFSISKVCSEFIKWRYVFPWSLCSQTQPY